MGKVILDIRKLKKLEKNKEKLNEKLDKIQEKVDAGADYEQIDHALEDYKTELEASMKLDQTDFSGDAANDYKYGFKLPLACLSDEKCDWICENMV